MITDLTPKDILDWASARRDARRDPRTGDFVPVRFASPAQEREEWRIYIMEIDASISEYQRWLSELIPGTSFAERKRPVYWDRIMELERSKKDLSGRIKELDAVIAKESPSSLG